MRRPVALVLGGLLLGGCGTAASDDALPAPQAAAAAAVPEAVAAVAPVALRIPAIGVEAKVGRLGLQSDGTVEVPAEPADTGWYRFGPAPGEAGSAVILGHVDSRTGPAVFARLKELKAGDKIVVTMSGGGKVRFAVDKVVTYRNEKFPAARVYGAHGAAMLNLVTCGGKYDAERGGYQSNVVVYTSEAGPA